MNEDPFFLPTTGMYVTQRWGGAYHGDTLFQEPDSFERVPIVGLLYPRRPGLGPEHEPKWVVREDGYWAELGHWWFGVGLSPDLPTYEPSQC